MCTVQSFKALDCGRAQVQNCLCASVLARVSTDIRIGGGVIRSTNFALWEDACGDALDGLGEGSINTCTAVFHPGREEYSIYSWRLRQDYYFAKLEKDLLTLRVASHSFTNTL